MLDGDHMEFPMQFMDAQDDEFQKGVALAKASVHDGFGRVAGLRKGFVYGDEASREAAETAYQERKERLSYKNRGS
jgi:hypothetical protein